MGSLILLVFLYCCVVSCFVPQQNRLRPPMSAPELPMAPAVRLPTHPPPGPCWSSLGRGQPFCWSPGHLCCLLFTYATAYQNHSWPWLPSWARRRSPREWPCASCSARGHRRPLPPPVHALSARWACTDMSLPFCASWVTPESKPCLPDSLEARRQCGHQSPPPQAEEPWL